MSDERDRNGNLKRKRKRNQRKPVWLKILMILAAILLLAVVVGIGAFYLTFNKMDKVNLDKSALGISTEDLSGYNNYKKIKNIALFGVDSTDGGSSGRSDAIMVATLDPVHDKLKVTSIMRDSYVTIEGYGYDKINHSYAYGGATLAIKTINKNFGLNIEDYLAVDFSSLPIIIDSLGGIQINVTEEEINAQININSYINDLNSSNGTNSPNIYTAGPQFVDGTQALAYSRIRYTTGGDAERTQRQRTVLSALFEKITTIAPTQYLGLINNVLPYVQTNLAANDVLSLSTKVAAIGTSQLEQERFPRDEFSWSETINGVSYIVFDEAATKKQFMDYIFNDN